MLAATRSGVRGGGATECAEIRRHSHVMVLMQRLIAAVHAECTGRMPPPLALQLLGVLQVSKKAVRIVLCVGGRDGQECRVLYEHTFSQP